MFKRRAAAFALLAGFAGVLAAWPGTDGWWEDATPNWLKERRYVDHGLCAARNQSPYPALGNIAFSTC